MEKCIFQKIAKIWVCIGSLKGFHPQLHLPQCQKWMLRKKGRKQRGNYTFQPILFLFHPSVLSKLPMDNWKLQILSYIYQLPKAVWPYKFSKQTFILCLGVFFTQVHEVGKVWKPTTGLEVFFCQLYDSGRISPQVGMHGPLQEHFVSISCNFQFPDPVRIFGVVLALAR